MSQRIRPLIEHEIDLAGDDILHRRRAATIGHERKPGGGRLLEVHAGDLGAARRPDGGGIALVRIGLEPGDQRFDIVGGEGLACNDQLRRVGEERDRREIVDDVIVELIGDGIDDVRAPLADADGLSVRLCPGETRHTDVAAGADHVLDHDRLVEGCPQRLGKNAAERVGRAAGWKRCDQCDRAGRSCLRDGASGNTQAAGQPGGERDGELKASHDAPPLGPAVERPPASTRS